MIDIIPAIDIIEGECVRLTKGDYADKTVYSENPADMAAMFEKAGFRRLHVVDLDGARLRHVVNTDALLGISQSTSLTVDFGGGMKTDADISAAFTSGASMVTVGSVAVTDSELFFSWLERYGADKIILGADVRGGKISVNGWHEDSQEELMPFLEKYVGRGVRNILCTDITRDGTLQGPSVDLYRNIMNKFPHVNLIASGGVSSADDIKRLVDCGIPSVVVGKAFYEGRITFEEITKLR